MSSEYTTTPCVGVNVEKIGDDWVVELWFPNTYTPMIRLAKGKRKFKTLMKAQGKLLRACSKMQRIVNDDLFGKKSKGSKGVLIAVPI